MYLVRTQINVYCIGIFDHEYTEMYVSSFMFHQLPKYVGRVFGANFDFPNIFIQKLIL